jgi:hypothetical protein
MKVVKERAMLDEKESRLAKMMNDLDERQVLGVSVFACVRVWYFWAYLWSVTSTHPGPQSKLRQMMTSMQEQEEQWRRSVADLQDREEMLEELKVRAIPFLLMN